MKGASVFFTVVPAPTTRTSPARTAGSGCAFSRTGVERAAVGEIWQARGDSAHAVGERLERGAPGLRDGVDRLQRRRPHRLGLEQPLTPAGCVSSERVLSPKNAGSWLFSFATTVSNPSVTVG